GLHSPLLRRRPRGAPTILAIPAFIGVVAAASRPALIAVNLPMSMNVLGLGLVAAELAIALCFITGVADWLGGLALSALVPLTALLASPFDALEQVLWAGIGVVVLVIGRTAV